MKCPKCGQEFEGRPSECPSCHVKFTFKKKEEEKITFDESGNVIQPAKSDEEIKKEIIEKCKKEFVTSIKYHAVLRILSHIYFIFYLVYFLKLIKSKIESPEGWTLYNIVSSLFISVLSLICLIVVIICLRNICSKTRQQIIKKFKSLGKDGVRRFFMGKGKYIFLTVSMQIFVTGILFAFGMFTFLPMIASLPSQIL